MERRSSAVVAGALWALALVGAPAAASAHELPANTARITLRDDHVDVQAELDVLALIANEGAGPNAAELAAASDNELSAVVERAKEALAREARLSADGAPVEIEVRAFPSPVDIRAIAEWASAAPREHGALLTVRLESEGAVRGASQIALRLPRALGPALISFVQPAAQWTPPGALSAFAVLEPAGARSIANAGASSPKPWLAGAAAALALAAALSNLAIRRRDVNSQRFKWSTK